MSLNKILLRASLLGENTAENDQAKLSENFIETPEYRSVLESKDSTVVVGRRGTGKSAMFLRLQSHWGALKTSNVIQISPDDYQIISFRGLFKKFEGNYTHARAAAKLFWKFGLLMEMLSHLSKNYKTKHLFSSQSPTNSLVKHWNVETTDFFSKIRHRVNEIIKSNESPSDILGDIHSKLQISILEREFEEINKVAQISFFILLDRLDEGHENDAIGVGIVSGAISTISDINKKFQYVRPILFLRDNINRAIAKYDPDYSRNIEGELLRIHWDTHQLLNLVGKRLNAAFNLKLEQSQRIWDRCTANELKSLDGFRLCLQFTLYRPRDLLSLLNQAFFNAARESRDTIILSDIDQTAKIISVTRLEDLIKEYKEIFPLIEISTHVFANKNPELSHSEAADILAETIMHPSIKNNIEAMRDWEILKADGVIRALYSVGFLGIHDVASNTFMFCHDGRNPDKEFETTDRVLIHPCYWIGLNLTRSALSLDEAEAINDEYEIKVTSVTPEIRASKIGTIMAEINSIPEGIEGASAYESWCLTALQTIFAGHLSNLECKPNGSAVQRRDIVGTNLSKTPAWMRIFEDYKARQVVFEVKNFAQIGRDEYRQMSTYLVTNYGNLGFIITRNEDEAIKTNELDWVKEIYTTSNKLIIRISHKFLIRMLSKLRSPEKHDAVDKGLNGILDTYERRYLSIQSTRKTK
jgi:hypothetical protein